MPYSPAFGLRIGDGTLDLAVRRRGDHTVIEHIGGPSRHRGAGDRR